MTRPGLFGELRSLLHQRPSHEAWATLWDLLADHGDQDDLLSYAEGALARWPDDLRVIPQVAIEAAREGRVRARLLGLARCLDLRQLAGDRALIAVLDSLPALTLSAVAVTSSRLGDRGARALAQRADAGTWRQLRLSGNDIGAGGLLALASCPELAGLRRLDLSFNVLSDAAIAGLTMAPRGLREQVRRAVTRRERVAHVRPTELLLHNNNIAADGLELLLDAQLIATLKHLHLAFNPLGTDLTASRRVTRAVARLDEAAERMPDLVELRLQACQLGDVGVAALAQGRFSALEELGLSANHISPEGLQRLTAQPHDRMPALKRLSLQWNPLAAQGLDLLGRWTRIPHLTMLDLGAHHAPQGALVAFLRDADLVSLIDLRLARNAIDGPALAALDRLARLGQLRHLDLSQNPLDGALHHLGARAPLSRLEQLTLRDCSLDDAALAELCPRRLPGLRDLDLGKNHHISPGAIAHLAAWPLRRLVLDQTRASRLSHDEFVDLLGPQVDVITSRAGRRRSS